MIQSNAMIRTELDPDDSESQLVKLENAVSQEHPVAFAGRLLRGRYHWAILLGTILAAAGAFGGYKANIPKYQSSGQIRIRAVIPHVLQNGETAMPMFESFIQSQMSILQSPRTLDNAKQAPEWLAAHPNTPNPDFVGNKLIVEHKPGSETFEVHYLDTKSNVASAAVKSIINAYQKIFDENNARNDEKLMEALERRRDNLNRQLDGLKRKVDDIANDYGTDNLEIIYRIKEEERARQENQLQKLQMELSIQEANQKPDDALIPSEGLTNEMIAKRYPSMADYLRIQNAQEAKISWLYTYVGENHQSVRAARADLDSTCAQIERLRAEYLQTMSDPTLAGAGDNLPMGPEQLRQREKILLTLYEQVKKEALEIGRAQLLLKGHKDEINIVQNSLLEVKQRVDNLNVEAPISGRISIISEGQRPLKVGDKRITFAGLGGFAGMVLGIGFIMFRGYSDKRIKDLADAQYTFKNVTKFLGFLPILPEDTSDPMQVSLAAHCVHHIRMLLQLNPRIHARPIWSITSAEPSDGKTSISLALGMSFAAAGLKTLLIDCDLIGGGLTTRMSPAARHRKLGQILIREGWINEEILTAALKRTQTSGRQLGEELVNVGILSRSDLDHALTLQRSTPIGLQDVLAGDHIEDCISPTGIPNLYILPLAQSDAEHAGHVSPRTIRRLVAEAREHFETVIIDTGPVLGSLEAAVIAAQVDEVVLTVPRNQSRTLADLAISQLKTTGARLAGIIFNRVQPSDATLAHSPSPGIRQPPPPSTNGSHSNGSTKLDQTVAAQNNRSFEDN